MKKGFTLVELLIVVSLSVVISAVLVAILINNTELVYKENSRVSQGLDLNDALANIKTYIRQAQSVASSYPETPPVSYTSSSTQLVLKFVSLDANGEVVQATFDFVIYLKDQDKLKILVIPGSGSSRLPQDSILAKNVSEVLFDYFDSNGVPIAPNAAEKVKITLSLKQKAGSSIETNIATGEANLRND